MFAIDQDTFSLRFTLLTFVAGAVARTAAVFIPIGLYALCRKCRLTVTFKQLLIVYVSGLIRGAIAFALSLKISDKLAPHKD